jgi:hypothetical protein
MPSSRADDAELADTVAHEGLHKQRDIAGVTEEKRPAIFGGSLVGRNALGHPDTHQLIELQRILTAQKTYPTPENFNANAEETYATYAGIEGRLPKGTAITSRPEFAELNQNQALKNLLFSETSVPYGGVWEGQTDNPTDKFNPLAGISKLIAKVTQVSAQPRANLMQMIGNLIGTR